jgi:Transcriptional Coactivator p15 (PC4)
VGQLIADIEKNSREIIRIEVTEFKGRELINLRIWYSDFDGSFKPTQKGVALDISQYVKLKDAIDKIGEYLQDKTKGIIPDINEKTEDTVEMIENEEDTENSPEETEEKPPVAKKTNKAKTRY